MSKKTDNLEIVKKTRPKRVPLRKQKILDAKPRPGYVRRWVNDEFGRIAAFKAAGWTPVVGDEDASERRAQDESKFGTAVIRVVNRGSTARANIAVLMEIPEELYEADQIAKQEELDRTEKALDPHGVGIYGKLTKTYS